MERLKLFQSHFLSHAHQIPDLLDQKKLVLWAKLEISLGVQTGKIFLWKNNSLSHFPERKMCSAEKRELQKNINYF